MNQELKAWIITADMGYGHQRAVFPLEYLANEGIITVNDSKYTNTSEKKLWKKLLHGYEMVSRAKQIPLIGEHLFKMLDLLLDIPSYYPKRNLSKPTYQVRMLYKMIRKGLCKGVLKNIIENETMPLITSFYAPAIAADIRKIEQIYCIICDSDLNRAWVAKNPLQSNVNYFVPCFHAYKRLKQYGVDKEKIFLTGFPLSLKLLGDESLNSLRHDLGQRLFYLDPNNRFWTLHERNIEYYLGKENCEFKRERVLTILFAVGGAGAQKEIGKEIALSLKEELAKNEVRLILSAGTKANVFDYFEEVKHRLNDCPNIEIIYSKTKPEYFEAFDEAIRGTDILWTKPSELTFYCGLGLPIIMTEAIGSQERCNRKWIGEIQAGFKQEDPEYSHQWLFDLLNEGRLAEAAWSGFLKARKKGVFNIMEVLRTGKLEESNSPLER